MEKPLSALKRENQVLTLQSETGKWFKGELTHSEHMREFVSIPVPVFAHIQGGGGLSMSGEQQGHSPHIFRSAGNQTLFTLISRLH